MKKNKVLYALQATGNGHICRAQELIPELQKQMHLDVVCSGSESDISVGHDVIKYYSGFSFVFGKNGGIQLFKSLIRNNIFKLLFEIFTAPVKNYDFVINDFEPVTAWACRLRGVPCVAMSHQYALLAEVPKPKKVPKIADWILRNYAPVKKGIGFHFESYASHIFLPIIRSSIRNQKVEAGKHITVYLPAYDDRKISRLLSEIDSVEWQVFSKHTQEAYHYKNVAVFPPSGTAFQQSMAASCGVLCGAGFETPAEALYLGKKLMVIPMKDQYEQHYNAAALKTMGVQTLKKLSTKKLSKIRAWVEKPSQVKVRYHNQIDEIAPLLKTFYEASTQA